MKHIYDKSLERKPNADNTYYLKAEQLVQLGDITGNRNYYPQALECYSKAISIVRNAVYYTDRSKLHIKMGNPDLAAKDIVAAQSIGGSGNSSADMYSTHTVKNILKLSQVQGEVGKLIRAGKIPTELEKVFSGMIGVIADVDARISKNDDRLNIHDELLAKYAEELKQVKEQLSDMQKKQEAVPDLVVIIDSLEAEITRLNIKLKIHEELIIELDDKLKFCTTKEEFEKLTQKFYSTATLETLFDGRLKILEGKQQNQEKMLVSMDSALRESGIYDKQKIKEDFASLKNTDKELYDYAHSFYWNLSNYLLAYRAIATGSVQKVRDKNALEKIWDKVAPVVIGLSTSVMIGALLLSIIERGLIAINDAYGNLEFDRKIQKINEFITNYILEEDLQLAVASASLKIANIKKAEIAYLYCKKAAPTSMLEKAKVAVTEKVEAFNKIIDDIITKFTNINKIEITPANKLAIKDVILFINHVATTKEAVVVTKDSAPRIDEEISKVFASNLANTEVATYLAIERVLGNTIGVGTSIKESSDNKQGSYAKNSSATSTSNTNANNNNKVTSNKINVVNNNTVKISNAQSPTKDANDRQSYTDKTKVSPSISFVNNSSQTNVSKSDIDNKAGKINLKILLLSSKRQATIKK